MTNANEILKDHVTLDIECIDRIYLNGYIPNRQVTGQLVTVIGHIVCEVTPKICCYRPQVYEELKECLHCGG